MQNPVLAGFAFGIIKAVFPVSHNSQAAIAVVCLPH